MTILIDPAVLIRAGRDAVDHAGDLRRTTARIDLDVTTVDAAPAEALLADRLTALADRMADNGVSLEWIGRDFRGLDTRVSFRMMHHYNATWR